MPSHPAPCPARASDGSKEPTTKYLGTRTIVPTVRDNLFRICSNLGQRPPFFSKMRTFFKNRLAWLHFYYNLWCNHASRFLSCIFFLKTSFFSRRDSHSDRYVPVTYLYWIFLCNLSSYSHHTKVAIFKCP